MRQECHQPNPINQANQSTHESANLNYGCPVVLLGSFTSNQHYLHLHELRTISQARQSAVSSQSTQRGEFAFLVGKEPAIDPLKPTQIIGVVCKSKVFGQLGPRPGLLLELFLLLMRAPQYSEYHGKHIRSTLIAKHHHNKRQRQISHVT
jgi:hypothetical protein